MKQILTLAILLSGLVAQAGPFISGGRLYHIDCQSKNFDFSMTGTHGSISYKGEQLAELTCEYPHSPVPARPNTILYAACSTEETPNVVKLYYHGTGLPYAVAFFKTKNGVPNPITMKCGK
jgi:hypothetical protein